jgi:hypothetical protein
MKQSKLILLPVLMILVNLGRATISPSDKKANKDPLASSSVKVKGKTPTAVWTVHSAYNLIYD